MRKVSLAFLTAVIIGASLLQAPGTLASIGAQLVMLIGSAEKRASETDSWIGAAKGDQLMGGSFIRTLANSQVALMLANRTQIRLKQNSQLQIKSVAETAAWKANTVRLNKGRAWSQARPKSAPEVAGAAAPVTMETASATMSIRGTDWEVEILPDGATQLVVLSGTVDMFNDHGSVQVGNGEAAKAEPGKAPIKITLINPESRVQWVSSWKPQPQHWVAGQPGKYQRVVDQIDSGDYEGALRALRPLTRGDATAAVLAADLLVYEGEIDAASEMLTPHARDGQGDPRAVSLLAQAWARIDRETEAARLLDSALSNNASNIELLLARGGIAVLEGDAAAAQRSYSRAAELDANNAEAWYGLGLIASERHNVREAERLLKRALSINPDMGKAAAELASVDTFAGRLESAESAYSALLNEQSDNYPALTGRGINRLKAGDADAALDDFMRAGVIEPRYARAWLYSGVAFYRDDYHDRARQAFDKSTSLDKLDPVPHLLKSIVETDALQYGAAIAAAREAQQRLPYLKSLNQVANNQRGNANLGSALSEFGLEDWATRYAYDSYSPYWAGSPLFLADRYTGQFLKNSELFKGFITDPTVFGAPNRHSSLLTTPGHYGRVDALWEKDDWEKYSALGTVNGRVVQPFPMAYFLSGTYIDLESEEDDSDLESPLLILGLGAKPRHDIGVFAFMRQSEVEGTIRTEEFTNVPLETEDTRIDIGGNYKFAPDNQLWIKFGYNEQEVEFAGDFFSQSQADSLTEALAPILPPGESVSPDARIGFRSDVEIEEEFALRHTFNTGALQWSWGYETSSKEDSGLLTNTFDPYAIISIDETVEIDSDEAYLGLKYNVSPAITIAVDAFFHSATVSRTNFDNFELPSIGQSFVQEDAELERTYDDFNPRLGIVWRVAEGQSARIVVQRWRRPAAAATLGAVDTLGVALNDQLVVEGGLYERIRLQWDAEYSSRLFVQAYADHERIANGLAGRRDALTTFELVDLEELLNQQDVFTAVPNLEDTGLFAKGEVDTIGIAANMLRTENHSLSARYLWRDGEQKEPFDGNKIPYMPDNYLLLKSNWTLPNRFVVGTSAIYRSKRYKDDANTDELKAGWSFGVTGFWESPDKQHSLQVIIDNILTDDDAGIDPDPRYLLRYSFRF